MKASLRQQVHATLFALVCLAPLAAQEPTNAAEAAAKAQAAEKKAAREAAVAAKYYAWVATLPPAHQAWEKVLQANLGSFYLPGHQADKVAGKANAWDYVPDDPKLPRVLLIGDSVSRGYTLAVRAALAGRANVHRAPENCGGTSRALTKLEVWLGEGKWDVIHFNFGIHDRATPTGEYAKRLEQIIARLRQTGATLVWASTTPIPDDPAQKQTAASIVERNEIAAAVMARHRIPVDDLFGAVLPRVDELRLPAPNVHFKESGYDFLGQAAATAIAVHLPAGTK
jgi:lysophospholipase L1-like esterase